MNSMKHAAELFVISGLLCFSFGFPVYRLLLALKIVDKPNARSSHRKLTVRGGGIAILAAVVAGVILLPQRPEGTLLPALFFGTLLLAVVSFVDDLKSLPSALRFGCHACAAVMAMWAFRSHSLVVGLTSMSGLELFCGAGWVIAFLWLAGYTNAFNFMDGINGLAAGQTALTAAGSGILAGVATGHWGDPLIVLAFTLAGAAAGFLPHNFPRARMFMGDVSSAPLGFLLAALVLWLAAEYGGWLLIPLGLLHANFVLDTFITLGRRIAGGERWHEAHREHFYQRLVRAGKSHAFVTGSEMSLQVVVMLLMLYYVNAPIGSVRVALIGAVLVLWLGFFSYCEFTFRRAINGAASSRTDSSVA